MGGEKKKGKKKKKSPRVYFEPGKRPLLTIDKNEFEVEDISEVGLKFLVDREVSLTKNVKGSISFFQGDTIKMAGIIMWARGDAVWVDFDEPIQYDVLNKNQQAAYLKTDMTVPQLIKTEIKEETRYTVKDMAKLGISHERLKLWTTLGYIESSIKLEGGNKFSRFDLYMVKLFEFLVDYGVLEEEASLKIKILAKAGKNSTDIFFIKPFLLFSSKIDFNSLSKDVQHKLFQYLSGSDLLNEKESIKLTKIIKKLAPVFIDRDKRAKLQKTGLEGKKPIIVRMKKIMSMVDAVL